MIVAAFTAVAVALVAVGVLIGLWLTATADDGFDDGFDVDEMIASLDALQRIWERTVWEQGYTAAAEASGRKRTPGAK